MGVYEDMITNIIMGIVVLYTMRLQYKYYNMKMRKEIIEDKLLELAIYTTILEKVCKVDDKVKEELYTHIKERKDKLMGWWTKDRI